MPREVSGVRSLALGPGNQLYIGTVDNNIWCASLNMDLDSPLKGAVAKSVIQVSSVFWGVGYHLSWGDTPTSFPGSLNRRNWKRGCKLSRSFVPSLVQLLFTVGDDALDDFSKRKIVLKIVTEWHGVLAMFRLNILLREP